MAIKFFRKTKRLMLTDDDSVSVHTELGWISIHNSVPLAGGYKGRRFIGIDIMVDPERTGIEIRKQGNMPQLQTIWVREKEKKGAK